MKMNIYYFWSKWQSSSLKRRLSKDEHALQPGTMPGWTAAEEQFCSLFKPYFSSLSRELFTKRVEFLKLAGDADVRPMPGWLYVVIFMLVVGESLGFLYLASSFIGQEISANTATYVTVILALVFATILAFITHKAGEEYKTSSAKRDCFTQYKTRGQVGAMYHTSSIGLNEAQDKDEGQPAYTRRMNRIAIGEGDLGSFKLTKIFLTVVVLFAILMTGMRFYSFHAEQTRDSSALCSTVGGASGSGGTSPFPKVMTDSQSETDCSASKEASNDTTMSATAAFLVFALIFLLTQTVGFFAASQHTFTGGANSREAYNETRAFKSFESYERNFMPYIDSINAELKALQSNLQMRSGPNWRPTKTFSDYLRDTALPSARPASAHSQGSTPIVSLEQAKLRLTSMTVPDEKMGFIKSLPIEMQKEILVWLQEQKRISEAEAAKQAGPSDKDFEGLLG
jgi:hypothetical protein